ncbi:unnamed protein product [Polarella glacialis]|uniref:Polyketide synthase dehydratase domain-containing protein n=1 Tax=Polarella glacialis TaxID=89957 RepID=A0A813FFZ4_POLGL|nr:unnamed protein product [Polarella glacialis]
MAAEVASEPEVGAAAGKLREAKRLVRQECISEAEALLEEARAEFLRLSDSKGLLEVLCVRISAAVVDERAEEAQALANAALARAQEAGDRWAQAGLLRSLVEVHLAQGLPGLALQKAAEAEELLLVLGDKRAAGELLLLVGQAHLAGNSPKAALNAALQSVDLLSQPNNNSNNNNNNSDNNNNSNSVGEEAAAWCGVMQARLALGSYEEALGAAEAALVLYLDCGDEFGKSKTLLRIAEAHLAHSQAEKARKSAELAMHSFEEQGNQSWAAAALEVLVQALLALGLKREALRLAQRGLAQHLASGARRAIPRARSSVVRAFLALWQKKEALAEAEQALAAARASRSRRLEALMLQEVAELQLLLGSVEAAKEAADQALVLFKRLGDLVGQATAIQILGTAEDLRGVLEQHAAKDEEASQLIAQLGAAMGRRDGREFKKVLQACYEHEQVYTDDVERGIGPEIQKDPEGAYSFFLENQPENWKVEPQAAKTAHQLDRTLMYYLYRLGQMHYGPGFRLLRTAYRLGDETLGYDAPGCGTLRLLEDCPDWEETVGFHPGLLDCALQVNGLRYYQKDAA